MNEPTQKPPTTEDLDAGIRDRFIRTPDADLESEEIGEEALADMDEPTPEFNAQPNTAKVGLWGVYRLAERIERMLEEEEGEVTTAIEDAMKELDLRELEAIDAFGDYLRYCDTVIGAAKVEIQRLQALVKRQNARRDWAKGHARDLLKKKVEGQKKKSIRVGIRQYGLRAGKAELVVPEDFDPRSLPAHLQSWTEEIPATEAVPPQCSVNESAAIKHLQACEAAADRLRRGKPKAGDEELVPIDELAYVRRDPSFTYK